MAVKRIALSLLLTALFTAPLWHLHIIDRNMPLQKADLVPVWLGVSAALHGSDPYSEQTTIRSQTAYYGRPLRPSELSTFNHVGFVYPVYTAPVLAPLSWISLSTARWAFLIGMPILLCASTLLWFDITEIRLARSRVALWTFLAMVSFPVMWGLRLQQPTMLVAVLVAFGCWMLKSRNDLVAGLLMALATIKPQLVCLLIAWMILWAIAHRRWRFVWSFSSFALALLIGADAVMPGWLPQWKAAGIALLQYTHQQTVLQMTFGKWAAMVLTFAMVLVVLPLLWKLRECDASSSDFGKAISLALAGTIALMPTDLPMVYNQVFLIPGCFILIRAKPLGRYADLIRIIAIGFVCLVFLSVAVAFAGETIGAPSLLWYALPFSNVLLPLLISLFLILQLFTTKKLKHSNTVSASGRSEFRTAHLIPTLPYNLLPRNEPQRDTKPW